MLGVIVYLSQPHTNTHGMNQAGEKPDRVADDQISDDFMGAGSEDTEALGEADLFSPAFFDRISEQESVKKSNESLVEDSGQRVEIGKAPDLSNASMSIEQQVDDDYMLYDLDGGGYVEVSESDYSSSSIEELYSDFDKGGAPLSSLDTDGAMTIVSDQPVYEMGQDQ